jgi:hypothetical protein
VYSPVEMTPVLASPAPIAAPWLTGASPGGPEGAVDGGPYEVQWQAWRRPVVQRTGLTAMGMALPPA